MCVAPHGRWKEERYGGFGSAVAAVGYDSGYVKEATSRPRRIEIKAS
jgi:hypothetical protein